VLSILCGVIGLPVTPLGDRHYEDIGMDSFGNAKAVKDGPFQSPKVPFSYCLNFRALETVIKMSTEAKITLISEIASAEMCSMCLIFVLSIVGFCKNGFIRHC